MLWNDMVNRRPWAAHFCWGDTMTIYGADVSQLRELAKAVERAASLLSSRATSLQGQIHAAPWKGADGEHFRQDWTSNHRPSLERVVSSLRENSKILLKHAEEQENASGGKGAGSGSIPRPTPTVTRELPTIFPA